MKRALAIFLLVTLVGVIAASAQTPPMPKPGPELKKLEYFVGDWSFDGDMKPGPMGPGGKFTGTEHTEWMDGGFFIVSHSNVKMPTGDAKGLAVMGYNSQDKMYTYNAFNSMGENEKSMGMLEGDTWTWNNESNMGGQMMKGRFVIKTLSPTEYTFTFAMGPSGGDLATVMEGKATKKK
jgi:hypothetical protein